MLTPNNRLLLPLTVLGLFAALAACTETSEEARVRRMAAERFGVEAGVLRVTRRTDLSTDRHRFYRVSTRVAARPTGEPETVTLAVSRTDGGLLAPGSFDQLAREEDASRRIDQLGADRVAGWFGALGGACAPPIDDERGTATASRVDDGGVEIRYRFLVPGQTTHECVIQLAPDGSLRGTSTSALGPSARPQVSAARRARPRS